MSLQLCEVQAREDDREHTCVLAAGHDPQGEHRCACGERFTDQQGKEQSA